MIKYQHVHISVDLCFLKVDKPFITFESVRKIKK